MAGSRTAQSTFITDYGAPEIDAAIYMLNGGSCVSSENGVLKGVSGVIVQSGEVHITNGGRLTRRPRALMASSWGGAYGTIVNTGTIITTASDGSNKIEDAGDLCPYLMISRRAILFADTAPFAV